MSRTPIELIDTDTVRTIATPDEFYVNPPKTNEYFLINCTNCGEAYARRYDPRRLHIYIKMLCAKCEQSKRLKRSIDEPVFVRTKDDVRALPLTQSFKFICSQCGRTVIIKAGGKRAADWFSGICANCVISIRNKKHTDDYIEVIDPKQFEGMVRHQKFFITCKKCGKRQNHELFTRDCLPTYLKFLCTTCARADHMTGNQNGYKEETHVPILITDPNQFDSLPSKRPYKYYCRNCGRLQTVKQFDPRKIISNRQMLCNVCARARYIYKGVSFDSSWEVAIWIYAEEHNEPIEREPLAFVTAMWIDGAMHPLTVTPDFRYKGKFIEVKGAQYYKNRDYSDRMIFPYSRISRTEEKLSEWKKKFMDDLYEAKHQCELQNSVEFWGRKECQPYIDYVTEKYGPDYLLQFKVERHR